MSPPPGTKVYSSVGRDKTRKRNKSINYIIFTAQGGKKTIVLSLLSNLYLLIYLWHEKGKRKDYTITKTHFDSQRSDGRNVVLQQHCYGCWYCERNCDELVGGQDSEEPIKK